MYKYASESFQNHSQPKWKAPIIDQRASNKHNGQSTDVFYYSTLDGISAYTSLSVFSLHSFMFH